MDFFKVTGIAVGENDIAAICKFSHSRLGKVRYCRRMIGVDFSKQFPCLRKPFRSHNTGFRFIGKIPGKNPRMFAHDGNILLYVIDLFFCQTLDLLRSGKRPGAFRVFFSCPVKSLERFDDHFPFACPNRIKIMVECFQVFCKERVIDHNIFRRTERPGAFHNIPAQRDKRFSVNMGGSVFIDPDFPFLIGQFPEFDLLNKFVSGFHHGNPERIASVRKIFCIIYK